MANLTQTIPDYIGGVSKFPDDKKAPGEVTDCKNGYPDTTFGLTKRPGFKYIKSFGSSETEYNNSKWFHIHRDGDETYIGCIKPKVGGTNGSITIWNAKTGVEITSGSGLTVTSPAGDYLTGEKIVDYDILTIQDTTIITNKIKTVAMSAAPSFTARSQGTVRIKQVINSTAYTAKINSTSCTFTSDTSATLQEVVDGLAAAIQTKIDDNTLSGLTVSKQRDSLELVKTAAFTLTVSAGTDDTPISSYQDAVPNITYLPDHSKNGRVVQIFQTAQITEDDYYVKFVADDSTSGFGHWVETVAPNVSASLDTTSMPHELINTGVNTFTFRPISWEDRLVGDDTTNNQPSFIGKKIEQCFFYSNRLGFLAADNIIFSQAGDFYNFFKASARIQIDSDPVDVNVSSIEPVVLHGVVASAQGLILFSKAQQFLLTSPQGVLTPTNITIRNVSNFEMETDIDPVDNGTNLIFVSKTPGYTRVYRMYTQGQEYNPQVEDIGRAISEWIPASIEHVVTSPQNAFVALYGSTKRDMYFFRTHTMGNELTMQAWFNWELPGKVQFTVVDADIMYAVTAQGGEYTISSASINQTPEETILINSDGQRMNPCLDLYSRLNSDKVKYLAVDTLTIPTGLGGSGYTGTPVITIAPSQKEQGSGAEATCTQSSGVINSVTITKVGSGYTQGATVTVGVPWAQSTAYSSGDQVVNGGKVYTCDVGGTSASSGTGPSGDTADISDGTGNLTWDFAGTQATVNATIYQGTKCYIPFKNDTDLTPILVVGSNDSEVDGTKLFVESGFTTTPDGNMSDDTGAYFGISQDLSSVAANVIVGYSYAYDISLPKTYFRNQGRADTSGMVIINRYKFSMGLSGVCQFKLLPRGHAEWTNTAAVIDAQQYLANDVPLANQSVVTVPIHQRNNNFTMRVFSESPFPVSLTSMMWEGNYSPRYYRRA